MGNARSLPARARAAAVPMEARLADGARRNADGGCRIAFDFHPCDVPAALLAAGPGARFLVAVVQLGEEEQPVPPGAPITMGRPGQVYDDMKPAGQIGMLCQRSEDFRTFLTQRFNEPVTSPTAASEVVCRHCQVTRKRDITTGSEAARLWAQLDTEFRYWILRGELP